MLVSRAIDDHDSKKLQQILSVERFARDGDKDIYSKNYEYIKNVLDDKCRNDTFHIVSFIRCLLNSTILLPIKADSQETALIVFQTLNDRGLELSDSDIFKAKIYHNKKESERTNFISYWKKIENQAKDCEETIQKLFYYYMFYVRAQEGDVKSRTPGLRNFYLECPEKRLYNEKILSNFSKMLELWRVINIRQPFEVKAWENELKIRQVLDVLKLYPNEFWKYPVVVYFLRHSDSKNFNHNFEIFLKKLCSALILAYLWSPTVNSIKGSIVKLNSKIFNSECPDFVDFSKFYDYKVEIDELKCPNAKIVKMILFLVAYQYNEKLLPKSCEIEHIFPQKWDVRYLEMKECTDTEVREKIEHLGNKTLLEKKLNILASNGYFYEKKKEYKKSDITITRKLAEKTNDWGIDDICYRDKDLFDIFIKTMVSWKGLSFSKSNTEYSNNDMQVVIDLLEKGESS